MDSRKLYLNWDAFDQAILHGAAELEDTEWVNKGQCSGIYGIPRGGLVLAVALSHHLNLPLLEAPQKGCIIVDDVIESGRTFLKVLDECNRLGIRDTDIAAWVWISKNKDLSTGYHQFVDEDRWVVFPWEDATRADKDKAEYEQRTTAR